MPSRLVVVDTNVVVAALLTDDPQAPTARVLDGMLAGALPFVVSVALLAEYRAVLLRPAIRRRHGFGLEEVDRLLGALALEAIVRDPAMGTGAPDAGDQHLWDLLAACPGALLVTGDRLLHRKAPPGASVLTPAAFVHLNEGV